MEKSIRDLGKILAPAQIGLTVWPLAPLLRVHTHRQTNTHRQTHRHTDTQTFFKNHFFGLRDLKDHRIHKISKSIFFPDYNTFTILRI